jgi:hypothetical protein
MESNFSELIETLNLNEDIDTNFPINFFTNKIKKSTLKKPYDYKYYKLIPNVVNCVTSILPKNLYIFGLSLIEENNEENKILEEKYILKTIDKLKRNKEFKEEIGKYFNYYTIAGTTLYGELRDINDIEIKLNKFLFKISKETKKVIFISENNNQFNSDRNLTFQSEEFTIFTLVIKFAYQINKSNDKHFIDKIIQNKKEDYIGYKDSILTFANIKMKETLKFLGYKRYDYSRNFAYYKDILDNKSNLIRLNNRSDNSYVYMASGVNLSFNFNNQRNLLLRSSLKFKMLRNETYFDLFESLGKNFDKFKKISLGKFGLKFYRTKKSEKFKIDDVKLMKPEEIPFFNINSEKDGIKDIFQYYEKNYDLKIINEVQPIFITYIKQRKKNNNEENSTIILSHYILAKFTFILGKLDNDDIDLSPLNKFSAQEKFDMMLKPLKECENLRNKLLKQKKLMENIDLKEKENPNSNSNSNIDIDIESNFTYELKNIQTKILKDPELINCFREKIELMNRKRLDIKGLKAIDNYNSIDNWILIGVDITKSSLYEFFKKFQEAANTFGIKINDQPKIVEISKDTIKINNYKENIQNKYIDSYANKYNKDYLEELFYDLNKVNETKNYELVISVVSREFEDKDFYRLLKKTIKRSKMSIPSQNIKYSKICNPKTNLSYYTSVIVQIFAKLSRPLWRFKSPKIYDKTIIISYTVRRDLNLKKTLCTVSITIDKYFNDYIFLNEYTSDFNIFSPEVINLIEKGIKKLFSLKYEDIDEDYDNDNNNNENENNNINNYFFIDNLIILRDGLNESQKEISLKEEMKKENIDYLKKKCIKITKNSMKKKTKINTNTINNLKEPNICVLYITDNNDIKIFRNEETEKSKSGIDKFFDSSDTKNDVILGNVEIGTLVDHDADINLSNNHYEFHICSTHPTVGCSNFSKYSIVYDDTNFSDNLFALMYNLCFLYFNNPQPIKIPAPLYYSRKMNNYIIDILLGEIPEKMDFVNFSL